MNKIYEYLSFSGNSVECYGLDIVKNNLKENGFSILEFNPQSDNYCLLSLYWFDDVYKFIELKTKYPNKRFICGGLASWTYPNSIYKYADYIFIGEGDDWDGDLEKDYIINCKEIKKSNQHISSEIKNCIYSDMQTTETFKRGFVEISRGCKNKCLFCQYTWVKPYRENSIDMIEPILQLNKTKQMRFFSADRFAHSEFDKISNLIEKYKKKDTSSDASIKQILKNNHLLNKVSKVRFGIEGTSERLRKLINKNFSDDDLIQFFVLLFQNGFKTADIYMIYGLPTECKEDYYSWIKFLRKLDKEVKDFNFCFHWNAFTPSALTPFQFAPAADCGIKQNEFEIIVRDIQNKNNKFYYKPLKTNEFTLLKRLLIIKNNDKTDNLLKALALNEKKFKKNAYLLKKIYKDLTNKNIYSEVREDEEMPFDRFLNYDKKKLYNIYINAINKYKLAS